MSVAASDLTAFQVYEAKRDQLAAWAKTHYIDEFHLDPCPLLDAGCGEGFWGDIFADHGFTVSGFDHDPDYIAAGRYKYPRLDLQVADLDEDLPYAPGSFGVAFIRGVPCFYTYRLTKAREALKRLLTVVEPGGLLLAGVYSDDSGEKRPMLDGTQIWHHRHETYLDLAAEVGPIAHTATKGNYLQIGIRR